MLRTGITLPNYGPLANAANLVRLAQRAEGLGFDSIWVADHLVVPVETASIYPFDARAAPTAAQLDGLVEFYEPLITLAYLAAATTRLRLGVSVYVVPYRNPVVTAKLVATLDALSGGRVIFGAGVGWLREEFSAVGADARQRGRVTDEYLEVCRRLWRDAVASFDGAHYSLPPVRSGPKPVQRPWPPIWIGGNSAAARARAARLGDGWHLIDCSADAVVAHAAQFDADLAAAGRARTDCTLSLRRAVSQAALSEVRRERDAYAAAGVEYLVVSPPRTTSLAALEGSFDALAAALLG
ncbi:MAG: LLM class F420-dependent oxidoreductase [bacterium]